MFLFLLTILKHDINCEKSLFTSGEPFIYTGVYGVGGCISVEVSVSGNFFISVASNASNVLVTRYRIDYDDSLIMKYNGTTPSVSNMDRASDERDLFVYTLLEDGAISVGYGGFGLLEENCTTMSFDNSPYWEANYSESPTNETKCFIYTQHGTHKINMSLGKCYKCPTLRAYSGVDHLLVNLDSESEAVVQQPAEDVVTYIVLEPPDEGESDEKSIFFSLETDKTVTGVTGQMTAHRIEAEEPEVIIKIRYIGDLVAYAFVSLFSFGIVFLIVVVICKERNWGKLESMGDQERASVARVDFLSSYVSDI